MALIKGRGVRVEIATTFGAAKVVSAITNANPGVATSTAHAMVDGTIGYFESVEGMVNLEDQVARVDDVTTNNFELEGIDTTNFPAATGSSNFYPATAWATLDKATSYEIGGGEADKLDATVLLDEIRHEENGLLGAQNVTFNALSEDVNTQALSLIEAAALNQETLLFRITFKTGAVRLFRGEPSLPGESVQLGQLGTGSFSVGVKGRVLKLGAAA